jgi:hypothetical protein
MTARGEKTFMFAATPHEVVKGQDFAGVPHTTFYRWFTEPSPSGFRHIKSRLARLFEQPQPFGEPIAASRAMLGPEEDIPATLLDKMSIWPHVGMHGLIRTVGSQPSRETRADALYADVFLPHITDTPGFNVELGQPISFTSVALVSRSADYRTQRVEFVQPVNNEPVPAPTMYTEADK